MQVPDYIVEKEHIKLGICCFADVLENICAVMSQSVLRNDLVESVDIGFGESGNYEAVARESEEGAVSDINRLSDLSEYFNNVLEEFIVVFVTVVRKDRGFFVTA